MDDLITSQTFILPSITRGEGYLSYVRQFLRKQNFLISQK